MAEDFRLDDTDDGLIGALLAECRREQENCLYTSTTFLIWLRFLRFFRALLWGAAAIAAAIAASHILAGNPDLRILMAGAALLAVILPAVSRALRVDEMIDDYASSAAVFKNLQAEFRRAEHVWSRKPASEFEGEARRLFRAVNDARKPSRTPPEFCFQMARAKIKRGDYQHEADA